MSWMLLNGEVMQGLFVFVFVGFNENEGTIVEIKPSNNMSLQGDWGDCQGMQQITNLALFF